MSNYMYIKELREAVIALDVQGAMITTPDELGCLASFASLVIANGHRPPQAMTIAQINERIEQKIRKHEFQDGEMNALITCELLAGKLLEKERSADVKDLTDSQKALCDG